MSDNRRIWGIPDWMVKVTLAVALIEGFLVLRRLAGFDP